MAQLVWVDDGAYLFGEHGIPDRGGGHLEFVAEDGRARSSDVVVRRKIRSHAMRNALTREKEKEKVRAEGSQAGENSEYSTTSMQNRPTPQQERRVVRQHPQSRGVEPYGDLPVAASAHLKRLLHHYTTVFLQSTAAMTPRNQFMPFATKDLALFHTTMFLSAAHLIILDSVFPAHEVFYHKGQSLRCISERLSDPRQRSTDETICAIACFSQLEAVTGTVSAVRLHMKGLEQLIQMRGGLSGFESNPFLYRQLTWLDLQASIRLQQKPRFQPIGVLENDLLAHSPFLLPATPSKKSISKPGLPRLSGAVDRDPNHGLVEVYQGLCFLTTLKSLAASSNDPLFLDKLYFSDKIAIVERRAQFLKYAFSDDDDEDDDDNDDTNLLLRAFSEASLIYIYSVLRDFPDSNALHLDLQQQLRASLSQLPPLLLHHTTSSSRALVLWMLLVGGAVDQSSDTKSWFVARLAEAPSGAGLKLAEDPICAALGGYPWGDCMAVNGRAAMWRELGALGERRGMTVATMTGGVEGMRRYGVVVQER